MLKTLIVDDEIISSDLIKFYANRTGVLEIAGVVRNGIEATKFLGENEIELIFLDIEMPEMDGVELLKSMINPPMVILVTSRIEHGPTAFEHDVVDYLVKPVEYTRFQKAVNKVFEYQKSQKDAGDGVSSIYVRSNNKSIRLAYEEILYIEALADYVVFVTSEKKHIVHSTMKALESKLPIDIFIRTHRSYFINISKIEAIEDNNILINKSYVPVSSSYKEALSKKLNFL
ncbi:MAG: LytR/AlgR family response regulator transcription factor [Cytophagales bacterium]